MSYGVKKSTLEEMYSLELLCIPRSRSLELREDICKSEYICKKICKHNTFYIVAACECGASGEDS
jgi:hypothetical protein